MTRKLYYTDPLAAAYMAREFGVRVTDGGVFDDSYDMHIGLLEEYVKNNHPHKYHIYVDDYKIFEPKEGDLVFYKTLFPYILSRNNKPFFWPESEEQ